MSDWKSKLPTFNEVVSMTSKLAKDVKQSVCEIIADYKQKHPSTSPEAEQEVNKEESSKTETQGKREATSEKKTEARKTTPEDQKKE